MKLLNLHTVKYHSNCVYSLLSTYRQKLYIPRQIILILMSCLFHQDFLWRQSVTLSPSVVGWSIIYRFSYLFCIFIFFFIKTSYKTSFVFCFLMKPTFWAIWLHLMVCSNKSSGSETNKNSDLISSVNFQELVFRCPRMSGVHWGTVCFFQSHWLRRIVVMTSTQPFKLISLMAM